MRKKSIIILGSLVVALVVFGFVFSAFPLESVIGEFEEASTDIVFLYAFSVLLMQLVLTWRWKFVLKALGYGRVSFKKVNDYRIIGLAVSFLTPTAKLGGEPLRALVLSEQEDIEFDDVMSSVVIDKTIDFAMSGIFFLVGIIFLMTSIGFYDGFGWLYGAGFLLVLCIVLFYVRVLRGKTFITPFLRFLGFEFSSWMRPFFLRVERIERVVVSFYEKDKKAFLGATFISGLSWVVMFFEYWFAARIVGVTLGVFETFLVFTVVGLAFLIPLPMALGSLEAGQVGIFRLLGFSGSAGLGLSLVVRVKDLFLTVYGLIMLTVTGYKVGTVLGADEITQEVFEEDD